MADTPTLYYNALMNMLSAEHSKAQMLKIVTYIGNNQKKFDQLTAIFLTEPYRMSQRASWPLSNCAERYPSLVKKHLPVLLQFAKEENRHPSIKRNVMRIFAIVNIPKNMHGEIMNECIGNIENPSEAIAVQAFSLGILQKLTKIYPEIYSEIEMIIENRLPHASPAFISRVNKYRKAFYTK
ncbi:MAG: hypothetical protein ACK5NK_12785 [Niabella sp.]